MREYAAEGSEASFEEVVRRHLNLVYGTAVRLAGASWAEDVAQMVFVGMAQKARELSRRESVAGWLHTATRYVAAKVVRSEVRRSAREGEVLEMSIQNGRNEAWQGIKEHLDEAMGKLEEQDRSALLLRYFENLPHAEVARALGVSEDAAQKRAARALERLQAVLAERAPSLTAGALTAAITTCGAQAAPAGLLGSVTTFCAGCATTATPASAAIGTLMSIKTKTVLAAAVVITGVVVPTVLWQREKSDLLAAKEVMRRRVAQLEGDLQTEEERRRQMGAEAEWYKAQAGEVHRLRGEITRLRAEQAAHAPVMAPEAAEEPKPVELRGAIEPLDEMTEQIAELKARAFGKGEALTV